MDRLYRPADILFANKPLFDQTVALLDAVLSPDQPDITHVIAQSGGFEIVKGAVELAATEIDSDQTNLEAIEANTATIDDARTVTGWLVRKLTNHTRATMQQRVDAAVQPSLMPIADTPYQRMVAPRTISYTDRQFGAGAEKTRLKKAEFISSDAYHTAKGYLTYFDDKEDASSISRYVGIVVVDDTVIEAQTSIFTGHQEYDLCARFFPEQTAEIAHLLSGNFKDDRDLDHKLDLIAQISMTAPPMQVLSTIKKYCLSVKASTPLNSQLNVLPNLHAIRRLRDTLSNAQS